MMPESRKHLGFYEERAKKVKDVNAKAVKEYAVIHDGHKGEARVLQAILSDSQREVVGVDDTKFFLLMHRGAFSEMPESEILSYFRFNVPPTPPLLCCIPKDKREFIELQLRLEGLIP